MSDYKNTPSFFNTEAVLKKYLGNTSYYLTLRFVVAKLIELVKPEKVVELGSATGSTSIMLADRFENISFLGLDIRPDVIDIAKQEAALRNIKNVSFGEADMCRFSEQPVDAAFVFLLYSFHHIADPLELKEKFLFDMFSNMKPGTFLCIAETFIPEAAVDLSDENEILRLWQIRSEEGSASTFWNSLSGLSGDELNTANAISEYCKENEFFAGKLVAKRQDEYLIKRSWAQERGESIGFETTINRAVNALGDGVLLLRKPI